MIKVFEDYEPSNHQSTIYEIRDIFADKLSESNACVSVPRNGTGMFKIIAPGVPTTVIKIVEEGYESYSLDDVNNVKTYKPSYAPTHASEILKRIKKGG